MTVVARVENPHEPARNARTSADSARDHDDPSFATQLATMLDDKRRSGMFDQLILIAQPQLLGQLREQLSEPTRRLVQLEFNKELTRPTQESLRLHLSTFARV